MKPNVVFFVSCFGCGKQSHSLKFRVKPSPLKYGTSRGYPQLLPGISKAKRLTYRLSLVSNADRLLVMGTSLATYSAFRLVKQAREEGKPVLMISLGPSRADKLDGVDKMERKAGEVLRAYLDELIK